MSVTRRYFLKSGGIAAATFATAPSFLIRTAFAQTNANRSADDPILIAIFQRGAADGISMVVPFGDKHYSSLRPQIAITEPSRGGNDRAIDLNRYLQAKPDTNATPFRAVALSATLPRSLAGPASAVAMQRVGDFGIRGGRATPEVEALFADLYKDTFDAVKMLRTATSQQYVPSGGVQYPSSPFGQALLQ